MAHTVFTRCFCGHLILIRRDIRNLSAEKCGNCVVYVDVNRSPMHDINLVRYSESTVILLPPYIRVTSSEVTRMFWARISLQYGTGWRLITRRSDKILTHSFCLVMLPGNLTVRFSCLITGKSRRPLNIRFIHVVVNQSFWLRCAQMRPDDPGYFVKFVLISASNISVMVWWIYLMLSGAGSH